MDIALFDESVKTEACPAPGLACNFTIEMIILRWLWLQMRSNGFKVAGFWRCVWPAQSRQSPTVVPL